MPSTMKKAKHMNPNQIPGTCEWYTPQPRFYIWQTVQCQAKYLLLLIFDVTSFFTQS